MDTKTEFDVVDEAVDLREAETIELSLGDLDMVGGGAVGLVFG